MTSQTAEAVDLSRFRPNVGIVLARPDGKVWLGRRAGTPGPHNWQFPQGGVDDGEDLLTAAVRELREETGAVSVRPIGRTPDWMPYAFPAEHKGSKAARGWIGQKQIWFAFAFTGADSEIDLAAHHELEFDAWRWADPHEALAGVVPFKRPTYEAVIAHFGRLMPARGL